MLLSKDLKETIKMCEELVLKIAVVDELNGP